MQPLLKLVIGIVKNPRTRAVLALALQWIVNNPTVRQEFDRRFRKILESIRDASTVKDPADRILRTLDAVTNNIDSATHPAIDDEVRLGWRQRSAALREAVALAGSYEGRERKRALKPIESKTNALRDEVLLALLRPFTRELEQAEPKNQPTSKRRRLISRLRRNR